MSLLEKYLAGWGRRTRTPSLEPGQEIRVVITNYDGREDAAVARIGDTRVVVEGTGRNHVDKIARLEVTEFDDNEHVGRARLLEVVGETTY